MRKVRISHSLVIRLLRGSERFSPGGENEIRRRARANSRRTRTPLRDVASILARAWMEGMYGRDAGQLEEIRRSARERWRADHGELSAHPMNPSSTAFGVGGSRAPSSGDDLLAGARPSERPQPTSSRRDSSSLSNAQSEFESGSFAHSFDARGSAARRSLLFGAALGAGLLGWQTMTAARNVARALRPHVSPVLVTRETSQSARDAQGGAGGGGSPTRHATPGGGKRSRRA